MLRIGIIGAGGFIGSEIASYFSEKAYLVTYTKSLNNYVIETKSCINIGVGCYINIDYSHLNGCDFVYYLVGGRYRGQYTLEEQISWSIPQFNLFLEGVRNLHGNKPKIIFLSSGGTVYGSQEALCDEESQINPFGSYGKIKILLEDLLIQNSDRYCYQYIIIRLSNPYGIRQLVYGKHGLICQSLKSIKNSNSIILPKDCDVYRDYIYIDDLMIVFERLMEKKIIGIYNVCTGRSIAINQIIKILRQEVLNSFEIADVFNGETVKYNFLSNHRLMSVIGFVKFTPVESGIRLMIDKMKINENNCSLYQPN